MIWGLGFLTLGLAGLFALLGPTPTLAESAPPQAKTATTPEPASPEAVPITADDHPAQAETHRPARRHLTSSRSRTR
jgi:hypothetical protein